MQTVFHPPVARASDGVATLASELATRLTEARTRTLLLISALSEDDLRRQHDPLMSPILWDVGHIVHFEELWLTHNLSGTIEFSEMPGMYNPFEHPRATRAALPLPSLDELLRVGAVVRTDVLEMLGRMRFDTNHPLLRDGYVYHMVLQHEYQHNETILQTLQLKQGALYRAPRIAVGQTSPRNATTGSTEGVTDASMVPIDVGEAYIGTDDRIMAYDNERPHHMVQLAPFEIDVTPVTNGAYLEFMRDSGYQRHELWSADGRAWLTTSGAVAPQYWTCTDNVWHTRSMDRGAPVDPTHPVCHVCYYEAEAYATWAGKRLPTEYEWEVAASWDPDTQTQWQYPWGNIAPTALHANVDQLLFGTTPTGTYPRNVSPVGCYGMIGDVWEWTSSDFHGYPGYESFPYPEYSEAFFGTAYKVLRGGSWATRPGAIRNTFRNWDFPIRRQIFSGFRCARDR